MSTVIQLDDPRPTLAERLRAVLDGEAADARDDARRFIARPSMAPVPPDTPKEEYREKTLGWIRDMVAEGYTRLPYPAAQGGGGDRLRYMNIVEVIAHQDMSLAVKQGVQFGLFGMSVESLGTQKHHDKYLPEIMSGKLLGGFAMTEMAGGSDVQGISTEAVYDHKTRSFVIHTPDEGARKAYIGNAAKHGGMMVVFAQLKMSEDAESMGVHAFMVPIRDAEGKAAPGVTIEDCGHKAGLNGIDNGYLSFDRVSVPYDAMLDRFAQIGADGAYQSEIEKKTQRFFRMIGTLVTGRVFVSMVSLSGAKNALSAAVTNAESRKVFGETLLDKQATQARLMPHLAESYALHFMTRHMMGEYQKGNEYLETMAAAVKARASDSAMRAVDEARLLGGGAGYMSQQRFGALRDDMDIFRTFEGDNTVLRLLVAKNQMSRLAHKFGRASGLRKIGAMASMKLRGLFGRLGAPSGRTDAAHFLDPAFQNKVFAQRERSMMYALSDKYVKIMKAENAGVAANKCQSDMLAYAEAYAERLMMQKFIKAVNAQKDPEVKALLKDVCDLFAVQNLRKNGLWYVENGLMKPSAATALRRLERGLCEKIRPQAQTLVDAFGIPPEVLACAPRPPQPQTPPPPKNG